MKWGLGVTTALLCILFLVLVPSIFALTVEKKVEGNLKVGGKAGISLFFDNTFSTDLPIKIVDKNIIGVNGYDVQCLEHSIPPGQSQIQYEELQLIIDGTFTLDPATVTFSNPETGKKEEVKSREVKIKVAGGNAQGSAQGITTLYQCDGQRMQSTSISSQGGSFSMQVGGNGMQIQQQVQQQMQQQSQQSQQQTQQNQLENNQMSQDTQALQQQLRREMAEKQHMEQQFKQTLEGNKEFQEQLQQLIQQGFRPQQNDLNPSSNISGNFSYQMQHQNGNNVELKGEMQNNSISNMTLEEKKSEEQQEKSYWWMIWIFLFAMLCGVLAYYLNKRKNSVIETLLEPTAVEEPLDYHRLAKDYLKEAERLFDSGNGKDAFGKVSYAIRFFATHKYGLKKELTSTDLLRYLKKHKLESSSIQKCLEHCALVEFAKVKPEKRLFMESLNRGKDFIKYIV